MHLWLHTGHLIPHFHWITPSHVSSCLTFTFSADTSCVCLFNTCLTSTLPSSPTSVPHQAGVTVLRQRESTYPQCVRFYKQLLTKHSHPHVSGFRDCLLVCTTLQHATCVHVCARLYNMLYVYMCVHDSTTCYMCTCVCTTLQHATCVHVCARLYNMLYVYMCVHDSTTCYMCTCVCC